MKKMSAGMKLQTNRVRMIVDKHSEIYMQDYLY